MENFIKLISSFEDKKKINYIIDILNSCKNRRSANVIYDFEFALSVGSNVVANKMDLDSVIIAIIYCLSRGGMFSLDSVTNEEYLSKINALYMMSKLEMSTKQDTQVSLNKMY